MQSTTHTEATMKALATHTHAKLVSLFPLAAVGILVLASAALAGWAGRYI